MPPFSVTGCYMSLHLVTCCYLIFSVLHVVTPCYMTLLRVTSHEF